MAAKRKYVRTSGYFTRSKPERRKVRAEGKIRREVSKLRLQSRARKYKVPKPGSWK